MLHSRVKPKLFNVELEVSVFVWVFIFCLFEGLDLLLLFSVISAVYIFILQLHLIEPLFDITIVYELILR